MFIDKGQQLRARAANFMKTRLGSVGNRWAEWGLRGAGSSFAEGALGSVGFYKGPLGKYQFLGGAGTARGLLGLGIGAGVGAAVYKATDSPLLGVGAGAGAIWATRGSLRNSLGVGMKMLGPLFIGAGMVSGLQQEGLGGAVKALGRGAAEWGLWSVGFKALSVAFGSGGGVGAIKAGVAWPLRIAAGLGVAAGLGYGAYKGAQYFSERGRRAMSSEFAGNILPFQTEAAYTMRQRALQEISRSHTNSRTVLGQEAQLLHLR